MTRYLTDTFRFTFRFCTNWCVARPTSRTYAQDVMSNREMVIELVRKLPEDTPLEQIAREIELLAGMKIAREQARRGEGIPAEEARKLVKTWASRSS